MKAHKLSSCRASGRILGLYASGSDENFLWTNPALGTVPAAKDYFNRTSWLNPGGDRTWLGPEMDLFISDLAHPWETYCRPASP